MTKKENDLLENLYQAQMDRDSFKWHGLRMQKVLEKLIELDTNPDHLGHEYLEELKLLQFAAKVACNKAVDWEHKLAHIFDYPNNDGHGNGDFDE